MAFDDFYRLTCPVMSLESSFHSFSGQVGRSPQAGVYNSGLLTTVDSKLGKSMLKDWHFLITDRCHALMTTAFGNVFYWDAEEGICFLEVQGLQVTAITRDLHVFLNEFLTDPKILESVLRKDDFEELASLKGPLSYNRSFFLVPWQMLGGIEKAENYDVGDCDVYLSLVGQALQAKGFTREDLRRSP
ncbi:MAG TPA: T6SS immunity protein Tdi1 domain-containing protein [Planctomycetota bacterium]|nr:T6SS immunity protein Tdi1 domain-containing protein [Planctomycetota bacterium]